MRATRFFIFSTFLVLMFGFALSLPTIGDEDPEHGKYIFYIFYTPTKNVLGDTYQKMSGIFYCFTCVTVLSELFFGKNVLTFSFHFLCRLLLTNRPLFRPNQTHCTWKLLNLSCISVFDETDFLNNLSLWPSWVLQKSRKKSLSIYWELILLFFAPGQLEELSMQILIEAVKLAIRSWHF